MLWTRSDQARRCLLRNVEQSFETETMGCEIRMKVTVFGAGAIGGWIGARLANSGVSINVIARGDTFEALRSNGLTLISNGERLQASVNVECDAARLGIQDLVVLAVKAPALRGAAAQMKPLLGPDTVVVAAMNGVPWWFFHRFGDSLAGTQIESVDPGGAIARAIPPRQVVGCVVHAACILEAPAVINQFSGNKLILGEPSGGYTSRVRSLVDLFNSAGIETHASSQIQNDVWYKLWGNLCINPISSLTGATVDRIIADSDLRELLTKMMLEARTLGRRLGVSIDESPESRLQLLGSLGAFKSSMLQDADAGRKIELDALVGAVSELGRLVGVPTPTIDAILGLTRVNAQMRGLY